MKYLSIDIGITNVGVCIMTLPSESETLLPLKKNKSQKHPYPRKEQTFQLIQESKIERWSLDSIGFSWESADFLVPSICKHVQSYIEKYRVDVLLIERQDNRAKKKIYALMYGLYAYFLDKLPTRLVHASAKIKVCQMLGIEKEKSTKTKKRSSKHNYQQNKSVAVDACELLIHHKIIPPTLLDKTNALVEFKRLKKNDDVADAFLQAIAFHIWKPPLKLRQQQKQPKTKRKKRTLDQSKQTPSRKRRKKI